MCVCVCVLLVVDYYLFVYKLTTFYSLIIITFLIQCSSLCVCVREYVKMCAFPLKERWRVAKPLKSLILKCDKWCCSDRPKST